MISMGEITDIVAEDIFAFQNIATEFAKSRFLVLAEEFNENEKEAAEIQKIANFIKCIIFLEGDSFQLKIDLKDSSSNYLEIIDTGMDAPLAGGHGGIAVNPDGSTYRSQVPTELWGTRLDALAEEGIDVLGEIKRMLTDLFKDHIAQVISQSKPKIAELAKKHILQEFQSSQR